MAQDSGSRRTPLGGRAGATIVAVVPILAAFVYLLLGLTIGAWGWAWVFFLLVPIAYLVVYGPPGSRSRG
ncbi:hypothetical protein [Microbacterium sp.]|uniref:hypothetical protein n=1 Tax=Microbacterium sp. TaxID=51671 RepID=UPI002E2F5CBC|nr:hypothetical protein [Microbacterium sp.]HEX5730785.1 hypothetical protein [Microbacterium sp.]